MKHFYPIAVIAACFLLFACNSDSNNNLNNTYNRNKADTSAGKENVAVNEVANCIRTSKPADDFDAAKFHDPLPTGSITISKGHFTTYDPQVVSEATATEAAAIASTILSSEDFKRRVLRFSYQYENHCQSCGDNAPHQNERIPGKEVLERIYNASAVTINFDMKRGRCNGPLGSTCPGYDVITSNREAIACDMADLPFSYAYAVNICHEYMHKIGYCHTNHDRDDDIAHSVGWQAYYVAKALVPR